MFIAQNHSECNNARNEINKITLTGNIVPGIWYHKLLRSCGKSDTTTIAILSVLVFLHRYNGDTEFQLNFNYFKNKSNFSKWCHQVNNTARPRLYLNYFEQFNHTLRTFRLYQCNKTIHSLIFYHTSCSNNLVEE